MYSAGGNKTEGVPLGSSSFAANLEQGRTTVTATHLRFQILQPPPEIRQLRRSNQDHIKLDHHHTRKFQILLWSAHSRPTNLNAVAHIVLLQNLRYTPKYPLGVEMQAQLPDNQTTPSLEQPTIRREEFEDVGHEGRKVGFFRAGGDLGEKLEVVLDNLGCQLVLQDKSEAGSSRLRTGPIVS